MADSDWPLFAQRFGSSGERGQQYAWQAVHDSVFFMDSKEQCALWRELFGNPFRSVSLDPAVLHWQDATVPKLAQAIYEERAFDRLPTLADALEDAGCDNSDILAHCRGPGHTSGAAGWWTCCWGRSDPMTEAEWMGCSEPKVMLEFLSNASQRQRLLFAVACCRRIWHLLTDERSRAVVEKVEQYADGLVTIFDVSNASDIHDNAEATYDFKAPLWAAMYAVSPSHCQKAAFEAVEAAGCATWWESIPEDDPIISLIESAGRNTETEAQRRILHDIFGNPFHPAKLDPSWLIPTVKALTQSIYDERAFDRLPLLADTLKEAGRHDAEILAHCRGPRPHVRGCWVVDLFLGKE
jgi:hypothetical protein